ncbi:MAG TPA: hypothetical protein PL063_08075 [Candidatus Cloacimonadota bacterium]|jgi:hypothetical protein|nr:hypothetical protein [Candidatus Cloacimonadales bacterium]HOQ80318.1 hypothetical protein [Candidatus Cloacimonadota bacterium]HPK40039.1 hypothetical protein [Candidatus Cloacimonadota bacterium]HPY97156.1 hypothetical protein [Candidatus Cloacimonadota bacterium]HQB41603.1 hypothetical protein [Candidatus Cloacimonadota bacterium]
MKVPIVLMVLGLFLNVFSLLFIDIKLFLSSFIFFALVMIMYFMFFPYRVDTFILIATNLFFAGFNYYITGIWNFLQLDEPRNSPWICLFIKFKKIFLRFIVALLSIFVVIAILKSPDTFIVKSIKLIAIGALVPIAVLIVENLISILVSSIFMVCKVPFDDIKI